jgi:hypothetical protein
MRSIQNQRLTKRPADRYISWAWVVDMDVTYLRWKLVEAECDAVFAGGVDAVDGERGAGEGDLVEGEVCVGPLDERDSAAHFAGLV